MKLEGFTQDGLIELPGSSEAWKYSSLPKFLPDTLKAATPVASNNAHIVLSGSTVVTHSLPAGVEKVAAPKKTGLDTWGQLPQMGAALHLKITQDQTLEVLVARDGHAMEATLAYLNLEIAPAVKVKLIQRIQGSKAGVTSQRTEINLHADAQIDHAIILTEGAEALHVSQFESHLAERALLKQTFLVQGGQQIRLEVKATLGGVEGHADLASLTKLKGKSQVDVQSSLVHTAPHTTAKQLAKNLLDDESKAIFTGRVHIAQHAQKVAAEQMSRSLLLSKKAYAISQPQLEIFADDVKCAHGSTTGQIGEEASFYLLSRGIPAERVQHLLTHAFVQEVLQNSQWREVLTKELL
ncbi:MAG: SufD family Fe-S cluster assembly protein [Bacteriovoracia bacterium]